MHSAGLFLFFLNIQTLILVSMSGMWGSSRENDTHTRECFVSALQLLKGEMGLFPCLQGNPAILSQSVITALR